MLYIIATPIGNLKDMTYRAQEVLSSCDLILCEDTRKSSILLNHYKINKPLSSFHKFNEKQKEEKILEELEAGKEIALISDAGTPLFSDPGFSLVEACIKRGISYTSLPGACSIIQALSLSGFSTSPFQFIGFLPKKTQERKTKLTQALSYPGSSICFESPHRILQTLEAIDSLDDKRRLSISREMTKKFEQTLQGTPKELLEIFEKNKPRGEFVIVISASKEPFFSGDLEDIISSLQNFYGLSLKEAISTGAKIARKKKKDVYNLMIQKKKGSGQ
jgi:16S rRNA (cytidine1402-2'-O)-methyltransferase